MAEVKNIFISHIHEDDSMVSDLIELMKKSGLEARNASITSDKPNNAQSENYIKQKLSTRIKWASTVITLISDGTADSEWVNWEIEYAIKKGKCVIGVYAPGATDADIPDALNKYGYAAIVGWRKDLLVSMIKGEVAPEWHNPANGELRHPAWKIKRYSC